MQSAPLALGLSLVLLASGAVAACSAHSSPGANSNASAGSATAISTTAVASASVVPSTSAAKTPSAASVAPSSSATSSPPRTISATRSTTSPPPAISCAQATLNSLTPAQRIGQLLMVGVDLDNLLADDPGPKLPVGGVFLAGKSRASSAAVLARIDAIRKSVTAISGVRPQVALDQEGGYVQSLRGDDFPPIPTALVQGQLDQSELADGTTNWSKRLVQAGITLDLAPVADVVPAGTANANPPIGGADRQYGSTPESVSKSVTTVVSAMLRVKLGSTVKHFPGLGRVTANTDISAHAVDDQTNADDAALQPFRAAISARTTAVMISNATYPQLDPSQPAAFSAKIITGLLRNTLHFSGLVISDDLGNAVAVSGTPVGQRAVEFVAAGGDMVLTVQPTDLVPMTAALTAAWARSAIFRARVGAADLHVLQSKQSLGLLMCSRTDAPSS